MQLIETIRESVRLTRRGKGALAVVVLAIVLGWQFGARSLNAIAAPTLAAMGIGAVMLARAETPSLTLSTPEPGFPGETRTLTADISGTGLGTIEFRLPDGVLGTAETRVATLPATPEFDLELEQRGIYAVGPPSLAYRDPLGLLEREFQTEEATDVVVYPQQYSIDGNSVLARLFLDELEAERQEFDRLREYQAGDPLRNIHWKSSAKHDDFLVMEFAPSQRDETVSITATAPKGKVDEMARIAATITDLALDAGYNVELTTADGHIPPGQGESHRKTLLRLLARTTAGTPRATTSEDIDVNITVAQRELVVRIGDETYAASRLFDGEASATPMDDKRTPSDGPDDDSTPGDGDQSDDDTSQDTDDIEVTP